MTNYEKQSILSSIADCDRYIAKEEPRDPSLRPAETVKLLAWYKQHRAKLQAMLST